MYPYPISTYLHGRHEHLPAYEHLPEEFEVHIEDVYFEPGTPATWHEPETPDYLEVRRVVFADTKKELPHDLFEAYQAEIEQAAWDDLARREADADDLYDPPYPEDFPEFR